MDSELHRLRYRIRQLEREVRTLRAAAHGDDDPAPRYGTDRSPASPYVHRRPVTDGPEAAPR